MCLLLVALLSCWLCFAGEHVAWDDLNVEQQDLLQQAISARKNAYAPYSNYQVGSALKTVEGHVVTGTNVENGSYGLTICAERAAVFKAVSEGQTAIKMMALVTPNGAFPCGACREVIHEFNPNAQLIISDANRKNITVVNLKELLPHEGRFAGRS